MNKCHNCKYSNKVPSSTHYSCSKRNVIVTADSHGISSGWFSFPYDFDANWLESCTGYKNKNENFQYEREELLKIIFEQWNVLLTFFEKKIITSHLKVKLDDMFILDRMSKIQADNVDDISLEELRKLAKDFSSI